MNAMVRFRPILGPAAFSRQLFPPSVFLRCCADATSVAPLPRCNKTTDCTLCQIDTPPLGFFEPGAPRGSLFAIIAQLFGISKLTAL